MKLFGTVSLIATGILAVLSLVFYVLFGLFAVATQAVMAAAVASAAVFAILNRKAVAGFFRRSGSVKGAARILQIIVAGAILVFVYLIAGSLPFRIDLTSGSLYSLSDETKKVLKGITNELKVFYFKPAAAQGPLMEYQENLLKAYAEKNGNIRVRNVDPYQNRAMAVDYNVREDAVVVFEYRGNKVLVPFGKIFRQDPQTGGIIYKGEQAYTEALKTLLASKPKTVYVLTGHGEINPVDKGNRGYREIFERIAQDNVKLNQLNLLKLPQIPEDCGLIVIGNPVQTIGVDELDRINAYLADGGSVLLLMEFETHITANDILRQMGLFAVPNLAVEDQDYNPQLGRTTLVPQMPSSEITAPLLKENVPVVLPTATGIFMLPENRRVSRDRYEIQPLLKTSPNAYGETSLEQIRADKAVRDKNDLKGPLNVAYSVKRLGESVMNTREGAVTNRFESRLVVFGDSDFVRNVYVDQYGNADLLLNAVNFLLKREGSITIRAKSSRIREFQLTGSERRFLGAFSFAICVLYFIPGLIIVLNRRKHVKD